jgi:hypothetical protein
VNDKSVTIELTKNESLILFEWLSKQSAADRPIEIDPVEQFALDRLLAKFESALVEILDPNYKNILNEARKHLAVQKGL